jgi:hypothetical protein
LLSKQIAGQHQVTTYQESKHTTHAIMCYITDSISRTGFVMSPCKAASCCTLRKNKLVCKKVVPSKKVIRAKKSVRFSNINTVAFRHASKEDLQQAWNQQEDIEAIKTGIRGDIEAVHAVNGRLSQLDQSAHCYRGLETGISMDIYKLKKIWVKTTRQKVMDEQQMQKNLGIFDPERLSLASQASSSDATRTAAQIAELDFKAQL